MLFEILAKKRPNLATTPIALVNKHISDPVPKLPAGLERYQPLIEILLAKNPSERFASARQLQEYLVKFSK
jgi:serine/threonine-protein kinase PpkA